MPTLFYRCWLISCFVLFVPLQLVLCMSNSVNQHPTFWKAHLESPENVLELPASSCWVLRAGGVMKTECVQAFPVEKKWGSPITQDTQCLVTALSHYGLLMGLSLGKLPSLPPWWISPWLLNMIMAWGPSFLNFKGSKANMFDLKWLFLYYYYFLLIFSVITPIGNILLCLIYVTSTTISNWTMVQCKVWQNFCLFNHADKNTRLGFCWVFKGGKAEPKKTSPFSRPWVL